MSRLKEPSSWGGIVLIATGIASILAKDYATGAAQIISQAWSLFLRQSL